MGLGTERYTAGGIGREVQDQFAVQSNTRAAAAIAAGKFADEIVPITIPQRKGDPVVITPTKACAATPPWIHSQHSSQHLKKMARLRLEMQAKSAMQVRPLS
jgi:acetyl-CoA acetyltransferase